MVASLERPCSDLRLCRKYGLYRVIKNPFSPGAGLPILPGLAGESKSYAERLLNFPDIGPLSESESAEALRDPVADAGEEIEDAALKEIFQITKGYPYFLQEWGYQAWNHAAVSPISIGAVQGASELVRANLIKKGMIYSPAYGKLAFTVPLFDEFMRRSVPEFRRPGKEAH